MRNRNWIAEMVAWFIWSVVIHVGAAVGIAIGEFVVRWARIGIRYAWNALKPQPRRVIAFVRR